MNKLSVDIQRRCYAMSSDGNTAEVVMYGEIVERQPVDYWTGEPIEGEYIIQSEFISDLENLQKCSAITIRMNSCGGDAGVSIIIHNKLRELASAGTTLTCIVDGVAMSGGSLIMCACDTVKVNPSSLIMIHKCWSIVCGAYNADELRTQAKQCDAYDSAQIEIYKRKCALSETVIDHMMANTTYMTGREAVEKGFADELLENAEQLDISANGKNLYVNGRIMHIGGVAPSSIHKVCTGFIPEHKPKGKTDKGGKTAMTVEELRQEHPDLISLIEANATATAIKAEQERIRSIDAISALYPDAMVQAAKYGDTTCSAQELAYRGALEASAKGTGFLAGMRADANASGTQGVGATPTTAPDTLKAKTPEQELDEARQSVKALLHKKEG